MTSAIARSRIRAQDESGIAMIVAIVVLMVIGIFVSVAFAVALQTNTSTRRDANKINALEAAEAGLQIASYRLNMLRPQDSWCVGDGAGPPNAGNNECLSSTYTLGNGSTYSYVTTPTMSGSDSCVGLTVTGTTIYSQRCITALGTTNGVTARAQVRVAAFGAIPLFPYAGITGKDKVTNGNGATIAGVEATNGTLTLNNGVTYSGCELGPGGLASGGGLHGACTPVPPIVLAPVDPGTSNQTIASGKCGTPPGGEPAFQGTWCNDDYRITNGINGTGSPYDQSSGITFDAANRILSVNHPNATLTLSGGVYNFCEFDAPNNVTISLAPNTHTEIIIDAPGTGLNGAPGDDPGSGCPYYCPVTDSCAGQRTGQLNLNNNVTFLNASKDPLALQLYIYGWSDGTNTMSFLNNTDFWGLVFAPQSTLNMSNSSNNSTFWGGISGRIVNVSNNFHFTWWSTLGSLQGRTTGTYYRTAWAQCRPSPTTGDPASGCG
jgi:Tfp pilus assembly protein PilX